MSLKSDDYDPTETIEDLISMMRQTIGQPVWRLAGPEIEQFLRCALGTALHRAFCKAEALYVHESFKQAQQNSGNLLKAILTGFDVAKQKEEEKE